VERPAIVLIAAVAHDRVIGAQGGLPWRLPEDLKRFKATTLGHPVVMGRRTFASLGKPLVGRTNIVVTRQAGFAAPEGVRVAASPGEALDLALALHPKVFVIGGAELYQAALPRATEALLTLVDLRVEGDTRFPALAPDWHLAALEEAQVSSQGHRFALATLRRGPPDACALCALRAGRPPTPGIDPAMGRILADLVGGERS
jgi:dihydrofolate reductase